MARTHTDRTDDTDDPTSDVTREVRREDDGELVGRLLRVEDGCVPATVFGAALAPAADAEQAESLVREQGLSSLADRWWVRTPREIGEPWRQAWLLEVKPDRLRLRWDDPMLMRGGHGEWHRLMDLDIQRPRPA